MLDIVSNSSTGAFGQDIEIEDLAVRFGAITVISGLNLQIAGGELVTLLGPSGCGKTTTLRILAGLETPSSGEIRIGGQTVIFHAARHQYPGRKARAVDGFQSYAIWPHMSVAGNTGYGLKLRSMSAKEADARVSDALELVQMQDHADRSATQLSGGQQQRVALARALVVSPGVLLLDEPLSNLDAKLRTRMRLEIRALQQRIGCTAVYVTHDQEEALAVSDRVVVMRAGRIAQAGTPIEIYEKPRTPIRRRFVGAANLIEGTIRDNLGAGAIDTDSGQRIATASTGFVPGARATIAIRPANICLSAQAPGHDVNVWQMRIARRLSWGTRSNMRSTVRSAGSRRAARRPNGSNPARSCTRWPPLIIAFCSNPTTEASCFNSHASSKIAP